MLLPTRAGFTPSLMLVQASSHQHSTCYLQSDANVSALHSWPCTSVLIMCSLEMCQVHCAERGQALATIWNLYTAAANVTVGKSSPCWLGTDAHLPGQPQRPWQLCCIGIAYL